jgi:DNA-binding NarL/FixJ family response regulator
MSQAFRLDGRMVTSIDLMLVEDHAMLREGLTETLNEKPNLRVVGQCGSSSEALDLLKQIRPNLILLDIGLGAERALDFVARSREVGFEGRVLVITAGVSAQEAIQLVRSGVSGIMHKHHSSDTLCKVIERVAAGEAYLEQNYLQPLFRSVGANKRRLTDHERSALKLVVQGMNNAEISVTLKLSESATKSLMHEIFKKLGVRTRAQLIGVALQEQLDE